MVGGGEGAADGIAVDVVKSLVEVDKGKKKAENSSKNPQTVKAVAHRGLSMDVAVD